MSDFLILLVCGWPVLSVVATGALWAALRVGGDEADERAGDELE